MDYVNCKLCPRQCGVDRTKGQTGFCGCGDTALVAKTMLHKWEEPALAGNGGSGAVFFGGCTLQCRYCQNGAIVNRFSEDSEPDRIAALCNRSCMCALEARGVLTNQFANPFRTSQVWSIGGSNNATDRSDEKANVLGGAFSKSGNRGHKK